jgi:hypothetical protein
MAVRLLGYVALLLSDLIHTGAATTGAKLPAVLPLVLYNGKRPWNASLDLASLFQPPPPGAERLLPQLSYLLIDESRLRAEELALPSNLVASLFRLETCAPEDLPRLTADLAALLPSARTSCAGTSPLGCSNCCAGFFLEVQFPRRRYWRRCPCWKKPCSTGGTAPERTDG